MPLKINEGIRPPGGYKFRDGQGVLHIAPDLDALVKVVARYRQTANFDPGFPREEILDQLCSKYPQICSGKGVNFNAKALAIYVAHHIQKAFVQTGRAGRRHTCDENVAAARLAICKRCPNYVNWAKGCPPCQKASTEGLKTAIFPNPILPDSAQFACITGRDSLAVSIYDFNPVPLKTSPPECWRKPTEQ